MDSMYGFDALQIQNGRVVNRIVATKAFMAESGLTLVRADRYPPVNIGEPLPEPLPPPGGEQL